MQIARWITRASLLLSIAASPASATSVSFNPSASIGSIGDTLSIDVVVSDLGDQIVSAFDLSIGFDPAVATITGVSQGNQLNGGDSFASLFDVVSDPGRVNVSELSLLGDADLASLQRSPSIPLFTLDFRVLAADTTALSFLAGTVPGVPGLDLKGFDAGLLDVVGTPGSILGMRSVAPVPEPSSYMLMLAGGLVVLAAARRRRAIDAGASGEPVHLRSSR